jgi:hypothetical protein
MLWYMEHEATVLVIVCHFCLSLIFAGRIRVQFVERPSQTYAAQQIVNRFVTMSLIDLVTLKAAAKKKLLFNKPSSRAPYTVI